MRTDVLVLVVAALLLVPGAIAGPPTARAPYGPVAVLSGSFPACAPPRETMGCVPIPAGATGVDILVRDITQVRVSFRFEITDAEGGLVGVSYTCGNVPLWLPPESATLAFAPHVGAFLCAAPTEGTIEFAFATGS